VTWVKFKHVFVKAGAAFGATAIVGGALGAHAFRSLAPEQLAIFKTAMHYQLLHAVLLLALSLAEPSANSKPIVVSGLCIAGGTVLFSSGLSLVALAGWHQAAFLAPVGGTALIIGWLSLGFYRPR
jgi:uncharacterized membrane protein YgdD (TMEM256/DUF423 family)